jgi:PRTRC genetic system ThiF family protein
MADSGGEFGGVAVPQKLTEHLPQVNWQNRRIVITIVGCGATGSQIATGMPYLHQALLASGHPYGLRVFLVDGDRITETNCVRQPFSRSEVGLYKAVVLMNRLNMFWGLDWEAVPHFVRCGRDVPDSDFLISSVDTRAARAVIARVVSLKSRRFQYWFDSGNLADRGQFVLGQPLRKGRKDRAKRLPCVHELFPSIVHAPADKKDHLPACSAADALQMQEPYINSTIANHMLAVLARLFRHGRIEYHGGFVNLATGRVTPLTVDLATWLRLRKQAEKERAYLTRKPQNKARNGH